MAPKQQTEKGVAVTSPTNESPKKNIVVKPVDKKTITALVKEHVVNDKEGMPMFSDWKNLYKKLSLSNEEATVYLGGRDPRDYFREGLLHTSFVQTFENLLPEDEEEVVTMRRVIPYKDVLLFKKKKTNVYILLIPKRLARFELDSEGEFIGDSINYDISAVAFTGTGTPAAYEEGYFIQQLKKVLVHLTKVAEQRRIFSSEK